MLEMFQRRGGGSSIARSVSWRYVAASALPNPRLEIPFLRAFHQHDTVYLLNSRPASRNFGAASATASSVSARHASGNNFRRNPCNHMPLRNDLVPERKLSGEFPSCGGPMRYGRRPNLSGGGDWEVSGKGLYPRASALESNSSGLGQEAKRNIWLQEAHLPDEAAAARERGRSHHESGSYSTAARWVWSKWGSSDRQFESSRTCVGTSQLWLISANFGPPSTNIGRSGPNLGRVCPGRFRPNLADFDQLWSILMADFDHICPSSVNIGCARPPSGWFEPCSAKFGRFRPTLGRFRPKLADLDQVWPVATDFGRIRPNLAGADQVWPVAGQSRADVDQIGVRCRPHVSDFEQTWVGFFDQSWADFTRIWPMSTKVGGWFRPTLVLGRTSDFGFMQHSGALDVPDSGEFAVIHIFRISGTGVRPGSATATSASARHAGGSSGHRTLSKETPLRND